MRYAQDRVTGLLASSDVWGPVLRRHWRVFLIALGLTLVWLGLHGHASFFFWGLLINGLTLTTFKAGRFVLLGIGAFLLLFLPWSRHGK